MNLKDIEKKEQDMSKILRHCKRCGHGQYVPKYAKIKSCTYCGYPIYYDKRTEFKTELMRRINNEAKL